MDEEVIAEESKEIGEGGRRGGEREDGGEIITICGASSDTGGDRITVCGGMTGVKTCEGVEVTRKCSPTSGGGEMFVFLLCLGQENILGSLWHVLVEVVIVRGGAVILVVGGVVEVA